MTGWDDLKYVLHVAREGSTLAASRTLQTTQTTVMRRVAGLEAALGYALFERRRTGYLPTDALKQLMPKLEAVEAAHDAFDQEASATGRDIAGTVRLTAPELLVVPLVIPALAELRRHYPAIRVDLVTTDRLLDLTKGEADIALRAADPPTEGSLFGRRIREDDRWSVCCSKAYAALHGAPESTADFPRHTFIGVIEELYPANFTDWTAGVIPEENITFRQSSLSALIAAIRSGLGVSVAPDIIISADPDLVRCFSVDLDLGKEIWLLAPERHRSTAHVRAALDFLGGFLSQLARS